MPDTLERDHSVRRGDTLIHLRVPRGPDDRTGFRGRSSPGNQPGTPEAGGAGVFSLFVFFSCCSLVSGHCSLFPVSNPYFLGISLLSLPCNRFFLIFTPFSCSVQFPYSFIALVAEVHMTIIITFDWMIHPGYHHHPPHETKGWGRPRVHPPVPPRVSSSFQVPCTGPPTRQSMVWCSTGNEGVISHKNDHIKSPRHENFLSGQPSPVTPCRTIKRTLWDYSKNT